MQAPRYLIVANPNGKRCQAYLRALSEFWQSRNATPEIRIVPWLDLIPRQGNLDGFSAFDHPALVRFESPGKDFDVARLLLREGALSAGENDTDWLSVPYDKGKQLRPGLLYAGLCRVLDGLRQSLESRPCLKATACPIAIAEMFDKNATSARLAAAGIPVPESISPPMTAIELLAELKERQFRTAYVKLNTGSSASCMAVVHPLDEPAWAWSSLLRLGEGFYSTRQLCQYEGDDLHAVIDFILAEGACVQRGIPMAQVDGQNFDVRMVMIAGKPAFHIFRLSNQPMTNLHFGGRRGDPDYCRRIVPMRAWLDALDHCVEAACLYDCTMIGIDILFERGFQRHHILEINAFGDFFPGVRDEIGRTVHAVQIEETAQQMGWL